MARGIVKTHPNLRRELGVFGATTMGLGAMIGTGVFVSIGIAAGITGPTVILAIGIAAVVAMCNALSSAQLAAIHPVSGGTYEYGYRYLKPFLGFTAGWMFLAAKTASAATAALGFSGYLLHAINCEGRLPVSSMAAVVAILVTTVVSAGIKRTHFANTLIVAMTLFALAAFVVFALPGALSDPRPNLSPLLPSGKTAIPDFLQACALMFVAFTGYGRIATMGEEVRNPRRIIPFAILTTLLLSAVIYICVAIAAVGSIGAPALGEATLRGLAPLESVLRQLGHPAVAKVVALGAMTAMLGVLLNLVLGLSRVVLAMGRRGDLPACFARLDRHASPKVAVILVGAAVAAVAWLGSLTLTWSFSAFTVLIYYAITNLAALRLPKADRLYPPIFAWIGLISCLLLAFWVEPKAWAAGLAVLGAGLGWHFLRLHHVLRLSDMPR